MISREASSRHQLFAAWCAPIFTVLTIVGWLWIAHFLFPAAASLTAEETAAFYVLHQDGVVLGCSIFLFACCFLIIVSVQLGLQLARIEGGLPLWSIVQVIGGAAIAVIVILDCSFWISAAYRPGAHPDVVVAMNDAAWLGFLLAWPVLSMQMIAAAIVTLADPRPVPLAPRWAGWASIAGAVLLATAGGPAFTHEGAFAFHGTLGFYLPMVIWGVWLDGHAWFMRKEILRERQPRSAVGRAA